MARFCANCGKEIRDGNAFCIGCGTKVDTDDTPAVPQAEASEQLKTDESALIDGDTILVDVVDDSKECDAEQGFDNPSTATEPELQSIPQQSAVTAATPAQSASSTASSAAPTEDSSCKVAGVGAFLGFEALFSLPLVGWILCIVMSFAPKNKNLKNFARARLIWILIGALLFTVSAVILLLLGNMLVTYLEAYLATGIADINWLPDGLSASEELADILNEIQSEIGYY